MHREHVKSLAVRRIAKLRPGGNTLAAGGIPSQRGPIRRFAEPEIAVALQAEAVAAIENGRVLAGMLASSRPAPIWPYSSSDARSWIWSRSPSWVPKTSKAWNRISAFTALRRSGQASAPSFGLLYRRL
jgi:hypothetical protein